jgi:hypothetical protein
MRVRKPKDVYAKQVKKFMKQNELHFIRNNKRFRTKLKMNRKQLSYAIQYLEKAGFLKSWSDKVYQMSHN